jgi:hypothetical protein
MDLDPQYLQLRRAVLGLDRAEVLIAPAEQFPRVWGALFEQRAGEHVATVLVVADGTTSLYLSSGGGVIGAGEHQAVRTASIAFLDAVERSLESFEAAPEPPLPGPDEVRIHALTYGTPGTIAASWDGLAAGRAPAQPLFEAGNEVLTQVRLLQEGER